MFSKNDILDRAMRSKTSYAARVEESAEHLAGHGIYREMAEYTLLAHNLMESRYDVPAGRPFVQVDIGSGSGRMLGAIAERCREAGRKCLLIGVEVNDVLARASARRLREEGLPVMEHIYGEESVEQKSRKNPVLRRRYPVRERAVEGMDLSGDRQIVIVQDDARKDMKVLLAVLGKLRERGLSHVDQISWAFPGTSGDLALQDSPDVHLSHDALLKRESPNMVRDIVGGAVRLAYGKLQKGGLLTLFQRLFTGKPLEEMYRGITGKPLPTEEGALLSARMLLAQAFILRDNAVKFNPKLGAVLHPNLQEAEAGTTLDYAGWSTGGDPSDTKSASQARDLFALSLVRSDLHEMGNTGSMIRTRSTEGE